MKHTCTWDSIGNKYYSNQLNGKWCLIVCAVVGVNEANLFMELNPDCSLLAYIGGLALIGFTEDLGVKEVL